MIPERTVSTPAGAGDVSRRSAAGGEFRFELAQPGHNLELQRYGARAVAPGAVRFALDRAPDYFAALRAEGSRSDVLLCRDAAGRLVATGQRSVKLAYLNGEAVQLGYLGGLNVANSARSARLLAQGYARFGELHRADPVQLYLTTIMEENSQAGKVLLSGRLGLPVYHDYGRFCGVALSLRSGSGGAAEPRTTLRRATAGDGLRVVDFLNREGRARQFFPAYRMEDFGRPGGLLPHLRWEDLWLAFRGTELIGTAAAWDQRAFRRWRVMGYAPWLRWLRAPMNLGAWFRRMPRLPRPGSTLDSFILSLVCVRDHDRSVFSALLSEIIRAQSGRFAGLLAGLHERDPLVPELLARPHVPLFSRLCLVDWNPGQPALQSLDRRRIPYLELGSL
jgi:hypothetical protein